MAPLPACRLSHGHPAEAWAITLAMATVSKAAPSRPGPSSLGGKLNSGELSRRVRWLGLARGQGSRSLSSGDSGRSGSWWDWVQLGRTGVAVPVVGTTLSDATATAATNSFNLN